MWRYIKDENGTATLELAIMLPIFLTLILGYMFIMNGVEKTMIMQTAAREAARAYANPIAGEDMDSYAKAVAQEELSKNDVSATIITVVEGVNNEKRKVIITTPYSSSFPMMDFDLKAGAVFHAEPYDN